MEALQIIQTASVLVGVVLIVYKSFRTENLMREELKRYKEVCNVRHNPLDEGLRSIHKDIREIRKDLSAVMIRVCRDG